MLGHVRKVLTFDAKNVSRIDNMKMKMKKIGWSNGRGRDDGR
jgi:hypothetical protein